MRSSHLVIGCLAILSFLVVPCLAVQINLPDATLTTTGLDDYDYLISTNVIDAQNCVDVEVHITGRITVASFPGTNSSWFEVGLISDPERVRALDTYGVPSYMFNQSVFMLYFLSPSGRAAQTSDYAGDFAGGLGPTHMVDPVFDFDLWLVPNVGGTGGVAYLSINGGPFDAGLTYGTDNWNNYGYGFSDEDLSQAALLAQLYSWDEGTTTISFENVIVEACYQPVASESTSWGNLKSLYR